MLIGAAAAFIVVEACMDHRCSSGRDSLLSSIEVCI